MNTSERGSQNQNEGEGSRTAARHYADGVKNTVESGNVEALADEAKQALNGPEGASLKRAEEFGKQGKPNS